MYACVNLIGVSEGCYKAEFDSTYPNRLNEVIRPNEFQQSIETINQSFTSKTAYIVLIVISTVCSVVGLGLLIGGIASTSSDSFPLFLVLFCPGISLIVVGMFACSIGSCIIRSRAADRMQKAVADESMKYSRRLTPCTWRLRTDETLEYQMSAAYQVTTLCSLPSFSLEIPLAILYKIRKLTVIIVYENST